MRKKARRILPRLIVIVLIVLLVLFVRTASYDEYSGYIQGTTFTVKCEYDGNISKLHHQIDSILLTVDESISTYVEGSVISKFNTSDSGVVVDTLFKNVFMCAQQIYMESHGDFDPSAAPLIWAYGFGPDKDTLLSDTVLAKLKNVIGLNRMQFSNGFLKKSHPESKLDFNAIGQGYTVDLVALHLESLNIRNYLVEIGGEVRVKGKNDKNELWKIGIDRPLENLPNRQIHSVMSLDNKSFATSGNYRKFYEKDGQRYAHTIDPHTGKSALSTLLSATVIHESCAMADGYATTLMVKGKEEAIAFADSLDLEIYLIYSEGEKLKEYVSESLSDKINH